MGTGINLSTQLYKKAKRLCTGQLKSAPLPEPRAYAGIMHHLHCQRPNSPIRRQKAVNPRLNPRIRPGHEGPGFQLTSALFSRALEYYYGNRQI